MKIVLIVRAVVPRFRRAGLAFTKNPTTLVRADLTDDQIKQLKEEPNLVVTEGTVEDEPQDTAPPVSQRQQLAILIGKLNIDNGDLWTTSGKPKTSVLEAQIGRTVTAEERDEAFALFQSYLQSDDEHLVDHAVDGATDTGE